MNENENHDNDGFFRKREEPKAGMRMDRCAARRLARWRTALLVKAIGHLD